MRAAVRSVPRSVRESVKRDTFTHVGVRAVASWRQNPDAADGAGPGPVGAYRPAAADPLPHQGDAVPDDLVMGPGAFGSMIRSGRIPGGSNLRVGPPGWPDIHAQCVREMPAQIAACTQEHGTDVGKPSPQPFVSRRSGAPRTGVQGNSGAVAHCVDQPNAGGWSAGVAPIRPAGGRGDRCTAHPESHQAPRCDGITVADVQDAGGQPSADRSGHQNWVHGVTEPGAAQHVAHRRRDNPVHHRLTVFTGWAMTSARSTAVTTFSKIAIVDSSTATSGHPGT